MVPENNSADFEGFCNNVVVTIFLPENNSVVMWHRALAQRAARPLSERTRVRL